MDKIEEDQVRPLSSNISIEYSGTMGRQIFIRYIALQTIPNAFKKSELIRELIRVGR